MTQSIRPYFDGLSRIAFLVGALLLSAVLAAPSSVAQDVPVVTEDEVDGTLQAGDTFTKEIRVRNLDQAADINAVDLTLDFNGAPVDFVGFNTSGTLLDGWFTDSGTEGTQASISGANTDALGGGTSSGVLVEAEFEVTGNGDGTVTFPDVRFNDVNPPDANLSQANFDVITTDTFIRIENATAKTGNASTVEVSATDLSGLGITNFDIEIEVEDPVELDSENPVNFLSDLDVQDANYNASTDVLSISGALSSGELVGNGPLFELNAEPVAGEATSALSFRNETELRDDNGDPVTAVALSDGQLQVSGNSAPSASDDSYSTGEESTLEVTDPGNGVLGNDTDPDGDELTASLVSGVSQGNLSLNDDGTFTYDPNGQFEGLGAGESATETFTYEAADGFGGTSEATATLTINGENDAPSISGLDDDDPTTIDEDNTAGPIEFTVDDPEGDLSTLTVTGSSGDTDLVQDASISETGPDQQGAASLTVTPRPDSNGTTDITVEVSDGAKSATGSFTLDVTPVNDEPTVTAIGDVTIDEDESTDPISFSIDDVESDAGDLTVTGRSGNSDLVADDGIEVEGSGEDRTVTVTPRADSNGTADITIEVEDPGGETGSETFALQVDPVNDAPIAVDDSYPNDDVEEVLEDETLRVSAPNGLTANDRHPDGEPFTVSEALVSTPGDGDVDLSADGSFRYTPDEDFAGTDQFEYEISDGDSTDTATVTINVEQINDQPTISELADQTINEDEVAGPITFTIDDVETDQENLALTKASSNTDLVPTDSIKLDRSGTDPAVTVKPTADSNGTATISLTVTDQEVDGKAAKDSTQSFELTVESINDPAVVETNEGLTLEEGATATIPTDSLSAFDVEDGAADITFDVTDGPSNGTLNVDGSEASTFTQADLEAGDVSYSHDGSETTSDSFTFDLSDSEGAGPTGETFDITVQPVNNAPEVATNEGLTLDEGSSETIPTDSLSASDADDVAADITFDVTDGPSNGTLNVDGSEASTFTQADLEAGDVSYSHDGSETTSDSFTFDLSDPDGAGPTGQTFDITVDPVNDGPTISGLADADTTIDEDTSTDPIGFTIGDPETDPSNLTLAKSSSNPSLVPTDSIELGGSGANRTVTVTPTADSNGTADITITVENGGEKTASQTFTVTVDPVNDDPVISGLPEADTIDEDSQAGPIGFSVDDPETPDDLELTKASSNTDLVPVDSIELGFGSDGRALTVTPTADSNGTADITVTVEDPEGASAEETFTLVVEPVPDAPVAVNDTFSVDEGEELVRSAPNGLLANDTHPDGEDFQAATFALEGPENGEVSIGSDGSFRYTPADGFAGTDQFVYQISDGDSTDTGTVTINVEAIEVTISGTVSYPGEGDGTLTDGRPLNGVPVKVSAVSGDMTVMDTTDSDGSFSVGVRTGEYVVEPQIDRDVPSAEINATDANRTIGAFLGSNAFVDGFQSEVADVNDSGKANATDALKMALFFNDPSGTTFEAGDWATTAPTADVTGGTDASVSVLAAAYGDADLSGAEQGGGSAVATAAGSASPSAKLEGESDLRGVEMDQTFEVPVRLSDGATLGSYSLQVDFPADKVSFEGVAGTDRNVMSTAENGTVRLSWFDQTGEQPVKLGSGASLVTLRFSAAEGVEKGTAVTPTVTAGELAGPDAQPLTSAQVSVEGVEIGSVLPDEFALQGSYPNPVSGGQATVEMDLPSRTTVTVEVYNTLGQRVQTIEQSMAAGTGQTLQVDGSRLASGQYFYRVQADLEDGTAEETGRITVVR